MPIIKKKQKQLKPARVLTLSLLGIIAAAVICWICESMYIRRRYTQLIRKKKKIAFEEDE